MVQWEALDEHETAWKPNGFHGLSYRARVESKHGQQRRVITRKVVTL